MTSQAVQDMLTQRGEAYRVVEAIYPVVVSTTPTKRYIYVCVPSAKLVQPEFCKAVGFALTLYKRLGVSRVVTLAMPDTPAFRAEAEALSTELADALPWLRFFYVAPEAVKSAVQAGTTPSTNPDWAPLVAKLLRVPTQVGTEQMLSREVLTKVKGERQIVGLASSGGALGVVRVSTALRNLPTLRFESAVCDVVLLIGKLCGAIAKTEKRRLRAEFWAAWPALATERVWADINVMASALRSHVPAVAKPAAHVRKTSPQARSQARSRTSATVGPVETSPQARERAHPSVRSHALPARSVENPVRTVSSASGNDYEGLEIPRLGSLYSILDRMPKRGGRR
jgi:hypothetical protein